jgi:hypothetical protein
MTNYNRDSGGRDERSSFMAGWRAGYAGAPKKGRGREYDRGWSAGHTDRIIDRAKHAL